MQTLRNALNMNLGSNDVDRGHLFRKLPSRIRCTNSCINGTYSDRLLRVLCSNEMVPNAPIHNKTHKNMSLGSNCVDRVCLLWRIPTRLPCMNFCFNSTYSARFASSFNGNETVPNASKHYETHQNISLGSNGVDWVHSLRKITTQLHCTNFCINCTYSARFAPSFK